LPRVLTDAGSFAVRGRQRQCFGSLKTLATEKITALFLAACSTEGISVISGHEAVFGGTMSETDTVPEGIEFAKGWRELLRAREALDRAQTYPAILDIVRATARTITGADGITFVQREGEECHYVAEDAISPLWLGRRFPLTECVSGWCMLHRAPAVIDDIYHDLRVPKDAYAATFVKSLAMVPVGIEEPIAAIGAYWASAGNPARESVFFLQGLAGAVEKAIARVKASAS
jgi:hypothetical protein